MYLWESDIRTGTKSGILYILQFTTYAVAFNHLPKKEDS